MSWTYIQSTGGLLNPEGTLMTHGYSGHAHGVNNPACQALPDIGPIPCGTYTLGPLIEDGGHLGPDVMHLIPDEETRAFILSLHRDPDSFWCHGGKVGESPTNGTASKGCVVLLRPDRLMLAGSEDRTVKVESGLAS